MHDVVVAASDDEVSKPFSGRMVYWGEPSDCPSGNQHRLTIGAIYTTADGLTVKSWDSTDWPCHDTEYTYHVAPEHIGHLRAALGAVGGDDLVELLAQHYEDGTVPTLSLDSWLTEHGVTCSASEKWHPN
jgi:hypothetical protein